MISTLSASERISAAGLERTARRAAEVPASRTEQWLGLLLPLLVRWTHRRLPVRARRRMDSGDLIQEALLGALQHLRDLEGRGPDALRAYVQQSIRNRIRDEIRRADKVEVAGGDAAEAADAASSPLERAISNQDRQRYRAALARLSAGDRALVVGRIERGLTYGQLAAASGKPSPDAARVATRRAVDRLAELIDEGP
jgi:RNA polymerase sigma factor (sigma-70 family)